MKHPPKEQTIINEDGLESPPPQLLFEIRRARLRKLGIDEEPIITLSFAQRNGTKKKSNSTGPGFANCRYTACQGISEGITPSRRAVTPCTEL
jgi:hypothetical protein